MSAHKQNRKASFVSGGDADIVQQMPFTVSDHPLQIFGIAGSPTPSARSTTLLRAALRLLAPRAASLGEIELRNLPPAALLHANASDAHVATALAGVAAADLVLVATPIYKAAYSGLLKVFLDLLPQDGLRDKIVLPLATGGSLAHLLALDYTLRPVLGALGARHILDTVFATDSQFDTDARFMREPHAEVTQRLSRALAPLLQRRGTEPAHRPAGGLSLAC
jgi:FMN reductase